MTLRHLRIFAAVYQEMSITGAARRLHLAQPSVSLAVKELEAAYQIRLFDRINRRLEATEKGKQFYEYAVQIIELFGEMEHVMGSPELPGRIKIGSSITAGSFLVPKAVNRFHQRYPDCQAEVTIQNSKQVMQAVLKNEQDLGVVEDYVESSQLERIPFLKDRLCFLCGAGHPLAEQGEVSLSELCSYPMLLREKGSASREIAEGVLRAHGMKGRILWESVSNQALIQGTKENLGITVLSERLVEAELRDGSIRKLPICPGAFLRSFSLIYHRKKYLTEPLRYMMQLFQETAEEEIDREL